MLDDDDSGESKKVMQRERREILSPVIRGIQDRESQHFSSISLHTLCIDLNQYNHLPLTGLTQSPSHSLHQLHKRCLKSLSISLSPLLFRSKKSIFLLFYFLSFVVLLLVLPGNQQPEQSFSFSPYLSSSSFLSPTFSLLSPSRPFLTKFG